MGTVVSAEPKSIVVKTTKGAETTIRLDEKTQVERNGMPGKLTDIAAGERVVVHAHKGQDGLTAAVVKVGAQGVKAGASTGKSASNSSKSPPTPESKPAGSDAHQHATSK